MAACHSGTTIRSPDHSDAAASLETKEADVNGTAVVTSTAPAATETGDRAWRTGEWTRSARVVLLIADSAARSSARPATRRVTSSMATSLRGAVLARGIWDGREGGRADVTGFEVTSSINAVYDQARD